jgi:signal transduction histidine kinase
MNSPPIRVLLVEDDDDDYFLTRTLFSEIKGNPFQLERIADYEAALESMGRNQHDVYLLDYRLGQRTGLDLLSEAVKQGCKAPIILLTGQDEREIDIEAIKAGAADFLTKGQIDAALLDRSIRYAIERRRDHEALRQAHDHLERRVQERTLALEKANQALLVEIGERKQAEAALRASESRFRQLADALKDADRHKDEFLAMLAHELRNPLAPIRNGLHILRMPKVDAPTTERVQVMMEQQVRNLTRLVDDLLDVSRITRGKIQLRKETIDVAAVIRNAVETVRPLIDLSKHELSVSLPDEPLFVEADPTRVEQIVTNLLSNAAKYTEPGGSIWLSAERVKSEVVVRVRDTGIGIPDELMPRIFDMFTQADRTLDRSQGGLGIGLTLVRQLVELHGGSVLAHSKGVGKGSEFMIRLPALVRQEPESPQPPKPAKPAKKETLRVLVVEDEAAVAEMLVMLLKLWGHAVRGVHDGHAALAALADFSPEIVLCDIGLPGMDGYELAGRVCQEKGASKPVLVAITGYGQEEDQRRARKAGFDYHMTKPVDPTALKELLANCSSSVAN